MSQLALVCPSFRTVPSPAAQWAHDIRNTLTTVGLHLDTLDRLAGSSGHKAVEAAHALMQRATSMCEQALAQSTRADEPARRRTVDVAAVIRQVADLLGPTAPAELDIRIHADGAIPVIADGEQVFRIIFNLVHNAVAVARRNVSLKTIDISIVPSAASVAVRIADDGPGLPAAVRKSLFRPGVASAGGSGVGLSIARELAERNGATLRLADCAKGAAFLLELAAPPALAAVKEGPVTRSLGRRAA